MVILFTLLQIHLNLPVQNRHILSLKNCNLCDYSLLLNCDLLFNNSIITAFRWTKKCQGILNCITKALVIFFSCWIYGFRLGLYVPLVSFLLKVEKVFWLITSGSTMSLLLLNLTSMLRLLHFAVDVFRPIKLGRYEEVCQVQNWEKNNKIRRGDIFCLLLNAFFPYQSQIFCEAIAQVT